MLDNRCKFELMQTVSTMDRFLDIFRRENSKAYAKPDGSVSGNIQSHIQQEIDQKLPKVFNTRSKST